MSGGGGGGEDMWATLLAGGGRIKCRKWAGELCFLLLHSGSRPESKRPACVSTAEF